MGGKSTSTTSPRLNQLSIQSSALGLPLALGWGRGRISRPNLIWYGAFTAIAHTTKTGGGKGLVGGGSSNTTYSYTSSFILALGEGQMSGILTVWKDTSVFTGAGALAAAGLSFSSGGLDQPTWGYLASRFPDQASPYSGIAYVYAQDYQLGDSGSLPNHSFEVDFAIQIGGGVPDADPKEILTDFLTNPAHGVPGWPAGMIGDLSDWSLYCRANNLLLSPVLESQTAASDCLIEWAMATNSAIFMSEGVLKVRPYGDMSATGNGVIWTPNLVPEYDLSENDFVVSSEGDAAVTVVINDQSDAYNIVQVEFLDRANGYNVAIASAQDLDNIIEFGPRKQDPTTIHSICDAAIARKSAQLLGQRTLYIRETYKHQLPWNFVLLEPTDLLTLTTVTDELQLFRELVRITQIDEDEDGLLSFECEGLDIGTALAAEYASHSGDGFAPNTEVAPGSVSAPALFTAPTSLTGFDPEIWLAVASTSLTWGGCEVWISADGDNYSRIGTINAPARYGTLSADLPAHADPDNDDTLHVDLSTSLGTLVGGSAADMNSGATLALVGTELVSYENAALTAAHHYDLSPLRRGLKGTASIAHSAGASFVRLDEAIFKFGYGDLNVGDEIHVKLPSFNQFGHTTENLADVAVYTILLGEGSSRYIDLSDDLAAIASDNVLSAGSEKQRAIIDWNAVHADTGALHDKFVALGSPPELAPAIADSDDAIADLGSYLGSLSPAWNDTMQDTPIVSSDWIEKWNAAYSGLALATAAITGQPGKDGHDGLPGSPGSDGVTLYTWIAYSDSADGSINFITAAPSGRNYIGRADNRTTPSESTNPTDYSWSQYTGPPAFGLVADGNAAVSGSKIIRSAGNTGAWDGQVYSSESYTGGAFVSFRALSPATFVGLNTDPTSGSWETLDFALYVEGGTNKLYAAENGTLIDLGTTATASDTLAVLYKGGTVYYYKDGSVIRSVGATPGLTIYLDSALAETQGDHAIVVAFAAAGADGSDGTSPYVFDLSASSVDIACTSAGVIKSGQLPRYLSPKVHQGATDVLSAATFSFSPSSSGLAADYSSAPSIEITQADSQGYIDITATIGSIAIGTKRVTVNRVLDAPPPASQTVQTGSKQDVIDRTDTSYGTHATNVLSIRTDASGKIGYNFYVTFDLEAVQSNPDKTLKLSGKPQYGATGGSGYSDWGSEVLCQTTAVAPGFASGSEPVLGELTVTGTITGLTPGVSYDVICAIRCSASVGAGAMQSFATETYSINQ